jgi:hypothetical protein
MRDYLSPATMARRFFEAYTQLAPAAAAQSQNQ